MTVSPFCQYCGKPVEDPYSFHRCDVEDLQRVIVSLRVDVNEKVKAVAFQERVALQFEKLWKESLR